MRRIIHDDQEFSNQSIINVIERFVKTVNLMEETILIPSRLMDRQVHDTKNRACFATWPDDEPIKNRSGSNNRKSHYLVPHINIPSREGYF